MKTGLLRVLSTSLSLSVLALFILAPVAEAADKRPDPVKAANNEFWLAAGSTVLNYKEVIPPPSLSDSERDPLFSFAGGASMMTDKGFFLAGDIDATIGPADYRGALLVTPTIPYNSTTHETMYSINARSGWGFHLADNLMFTPYGEVGMRYWERKLSASQIEKYNHFDVLAGMMLQYAPVNSLIFTLFGAAGTTLGPQMKYGGYTYDLGEALLWRAGTKLAYNISPRYEVFSTFSYQHFRYARSPEQPDTSYEPSSFTSEATARVGFGYKFN